ncbi:hypothetical protein C8Q78DRAFT_1029180 [Trametes maxima]|nr:hypothetical protein C8Q78DRAFT_1029180 [Trametes maxima]
MCQSDSAQELSVTFRPELYLQRRGWVLDIMRREGITEVLDIGCGEGELLSCLCNPAPWLAPPPPDVLLAANDLNDELAEMHQDILHPVKVAGLDISRSDLELAVQGTKPLPPEHKSGLWHEPTRWEPLEVKIWEGSLAHVNPGYVGVECVVSTEVIEHLPEDVLHAFAPVIFGAYHPRVVLLTTPSYTFNARFTAPNAPMEARSGWHDPTKRTSRVFRHHDHKFEWTVEEFTEWCNTVAEEWGYDVEIDGVGRAQEVDEWGRDEALGWASQVAAFRRREGGEWEEKRAGQVTRLGIQCQGGSEEGHTLLATHQHPAHEAARRPQPLSAVGTLVVDQMVDFRETSIALRELWFQGGIDAACGGWLDWLVRAVHVHHGLSLRHVVDGYTGGWQILLDASLHHLIPPKSQTDSSSPPDTDELGDPWDPYDEDIPWPDNSGEAIVTAHGEDVHVDNWGVEEVDWAKGVVDVQQAHKAWGTPATEWDCSSEWT